MGAAELAGLLRDYYGSYLLVFAGYNAGHSQVEKWIEGYGDPRDPKIDPIVTTSRLVNSSQPRLMHDRTVVVPAEGLIVRGNPSGLSIESHPLSIRRSIPVLRASSKASLCDGVALNKLRARWCSPSWLKPRD